MEEKEETSPSTDGDQKQEASQDADPVVDKLLADELDDSVEAPEAKLFALAQDDSDAVRVTGVPLQKATGDAKDTSGNDGADEDSGESASTEASKDE